MEKASDRSDEGAWPASSSVWCWSGTAAAGLGAAGELLLTSLCPWRPGLLAATPSSYSAKFLLSTLLPP